MALNADPEARATGESVGFAGLDPVDENMPFSGVEAGRRPARTAWGQGCATEAGRAVVDVGLTCLPASASAGGPRRVTTAGDLRSQAVMRRLGMAREPSDDFEDPSVPEGPLRRGMVLRLTAGVPEDTGWAGAVASARTPSLVPLSPRPTPRRTGRGRRSRRCPGWSRSGPRPGLRTSP
ncbi:GNAT family protein [Streptomyces bottropensis]|uniref:GNAT family N-acetyltransferase n=2 Tax=Streptomyces TaxID=1883 RepID=UPI0031F69D52